MNLLLYMVTFISLDRISKLVVLKWEHVAVSGGIFDCHNGGWRDTCSYWVEAWHAAMNTLQYTG